MSGELHSTFLREVYLHKLLRIPLHRKFVSSSPFIIYSIIYLCHYGLMDAYFIIWFITQQYFIHFAPQTLPYLATGSSFHLLPMPQAYPQHCRCMLVGWLVFSTLSYFLVLQGAPGSFCVFPIPVLESASSPRSLVPLIEEWFQKQRSGHQVYSLLLECYCFWPAQLPEQGNTCVYTNL